MSRILLAEDDDSLRGFLARALERAGHEVTACPDGEEAVTDPLDPDSDDDGLLDGEETVTLLKEHTHNREKYEAGDTLKVDAATAEWLREQGVIA